MLAAKQGNDSDAEANAFTQLLITRQHWIEMHVDAVGNVAVGQICLPKAGDSPRANRE
jgi:hypothetical protein